MNTTLRKDFSYLAILAVLCGILFTINLGGFGLLDPDEPFYSLTAKEMLQRGDLSTPVLFGHPQFEKPILFYWVMCAFFKLLGVSETAARLGSCVAGIFTVIVTYLWGRTLFRKPETALVSAVVLATASEFIIVSRVVLTDIYLCLFVTAALYAFSLGYFHPARRKIAWHALFVFSALAFLTKGLLGVLLPFMAIVIFLGITGEWALLGQLPWLGGGLLFALIGLPWYALMTVRYGTPFLSHFFIHENIRRFFVAEHGSFDRFYFYPGGLLLGFFPWTFALPFAFYYLCRKAGRGERDSRVFLWLAVIFLSFFVFFMAAKSKLLSYIFPVFPAAALMTGAWADMFLRRLSQGRIRRDFLWTATIILGAVPAALAAGVWFFGKKSGIDLTGHVIFFCATALVLAWGAVYFLWRRKPNISFFLITAFSVAFSILSFGFLLPAVDSLFASRDFVRTFERDAAGQEGRFFIASKLYVRGVSFYSGNKRMGVLTDDPKGTFYTRHPIPMISTTDDLLRLTDDDFPAYCFLRKKEYDFLKTIVNNRFTMKVLDDRPQRVLLRLDRT